MEQVMAKEYGLYNTSGRVWELYIPGLGCMASVDVVILAEEVYKND